MRRILLTIRRGEERADLVRRLRADGDEVLLARTGAEAITLLKRHLPDAALVDHDVPRPDGLSVAGWARDHVNLHRIPVILIVDLVALEHREGLVDCGAVDLIVRPLRYPEVQLRLDWRTDNVGRFSGLFAGQEASRAAIQQHVAALLDQHREREEEILGLLFTDPDTGLNSRAYFKIKLGEELKRAQRYGLALSALLIKLQTPGAAGRDEGAGPASPMTIKEIAGILLLESRDLDVIGHTSPSDFAMLLPSTNQDGAVLLAQRISERIITHPFVDNAGGRDFQVRIGVATYPMAGVRVAQDLMDRAREALGKAEDFGRREICIWEAQA
ncbi:MAG: diguanylate cyclase [Planctomycetes bacterium]|nr:diguanylate cyclase [Planctomycetota bacterium]